MEEVSVRPATAADLETILRYRQAMFQDMGHRDGKRLAEMRGSSEAYLRRALADGTYRGWRAVTGEGRVAAGGGIAIVPWPGSPDDPAAWRGWIQNVYTEPEFRYRGLARRIMEAIVDWCRGEGFYAVSLHASIFGRPLYDLNPAHSGLPGCRRNPC